MVAGGDRSAKIRTYNFPQGRVTDHRINLTLYKLDKVLEGELDNFIKELNIADRNMKLEEKVLPKILNLYLRSISSNRK